MQKKYKAKINNPCEKILFLGRAESGFGRMFRKS